jgi:hypothetical protein
MCIQGWMDTYFSTQRVRRKKNTSRGRGMFLALLHLRWLPLLLMPPLILNRFKVTWWLGRCMYCLRAELIYSPAWLMDRDKWAPTDFEIQNNRAHRTLHTAQCTGWGSGSRGSKGGLVQAGGEHPGAYTCHIHWNILSLSPKMTSMSLYNVSPNDLNVSLQCLPKWPHCLFTMSLQMTLYHRCDWRMVRG